MVTYFDMWYTVEFPINVVGLYFYYGFFLLQEFFIDDKNYK